MRAAVVQLSSPPDETVERRRHRVEGILRDHANGADLVVLPELWPGGYFAFERYSRDAELASANTLLICSEIARDLGCLVHSGSYLRRGEDGRLFNTSALIAPSGEVLCLYDKMHTFGYQSEESRLIAPGRRITVTDTSVGRIALATCYDLRFPGFWDQVGRLLPDIILVSAAWPQKRVSQWKLLTAARALESQAFLIGCNAVGRQYDVDLGGHSQVVDPLGRVIHDAGPDEGVTFCEFDPTLARHFRAEFPVYADRLHTYPGSTDAGEEIDCAHI